MLGPPGRYFRQVLAVPLAVRQGPPFRTSLVLCPGPDPSRTYFKAASQDQQAQAAQPTHGPASPYKVAVLTLAGAASTLCLLLRWRGAGAGIGTGLR